MTEEKGFTIIELLTAMMIIGVLAAIAWPYLVSYIEKARYAHAKIHIDAIYTHLEEYRVENDTYPPDVNRNTNPGIGFFPVNGETRIPFNSMYDYENWQVEEDGPCHVLVTFFGKNGDRDSPVNFIADEKRQFVEIGDDILFYVGTCDCAIEDRFLE